MNPITLPPAPQAHMSQASRSRAAIRAARLVPRRIRHGRPAILALRTTAALVLTEAAAHSGAGPAPVAGTLAAIATWLALTVRSDLAPAPGGTP